MILYTYQNYSLSVSGNWKRGVGGRFLPPPPLPARIAHPSKFKITIKDRPNFNAGTVQNPSYSQGECKSHSRTVQNFHSQTPLSRICSLHMMLKKIKVLLQYTHKLPINSAKVGMSSRLI